MLIAIDPGKYAIKAKNQSTKLSFRTKLLHLNDTNNSEPSGNCYQVSFDNQIGDTLELISAYISDTVPHSNIVDNASFVNVSGFYEIGEIKYAEADHNKLHQSR